MRRRRLGSTTTRPRGRSRPICWAWGIGASASFWGARNMGRPNSAISVPVDFDLVQTGNFEFADGLICAERMLRAAVPPTAIFASNDDMAAAVISVARKFGLSLPNQLSVTGFDD